MDKRKRKNIRLKNFDYSSNGMYFITICAKDRAKIFSEIDDGNIVLSEIGTIVENVWMNISTVENGVTALDFCIMPNHIHGILAFNRTNIMLGEIVRRFKARVSNKVGYSIWQRNYYEHVIRNEIDYCKIVEYIGNNPFNWENDIENI